MLQAKTRPTAEDAKLKDSLMLLQLGFEDLVKNNIYSKARKMIGTFLHSQGYEETVKELETKYNN